MYLNIIFIPVISLIVGLFFSNYLGRRGSILFNLISIFSVLIFVLVGFFDIYWSNSIICYDITSWIKILYLEINWFFLFDSLSISMLLIVVLISFLVHFYSVSYMLMDPYIIRFFLYLTLFTLFMILLVTAGNLLILFIGWEGVGLCSYLLISFWYTRKEANKSAIKAMFINRIGDFGFLVGIVYVIDLYGNLNFFTLYSITQEFNYNYNIMDYWTLFLICFCFLLGVIGKSSQIGLHTWLPDAMEGPTPVSALIHAATMVTAGVFLILRCSILFDLVPEVLFYITLIGSLTALMAATIGLVQNDIKKIIAYSTCSQLGYMVFSCGLSNYSVSLFHLINHAFFKALLFLGAGVIIHSLLEEQDIRKMGGLYRYLPFTYSIFLVSSFSLIGFPFLSGYYSKDFLIELAYISYSIEGYFAFLVGSIVAGLTAFYSFKLIYFVFFSGNRFSLIKLYKLHSYDVYNSVAVSVLILGSIFSGYLLKDLFLSFGTFFWINMLFYGDYINLYNGIFLMPLFYKFLPFLLSILGICGIYIIYIRFFQYFYNSFKQNFIYRWYIFLVKGWYFNNIYNYYFGENGRVLSFNIMYKLIDKGILELLGPKGLVVFFKKASKYILYYNSGKFYHYILTMFYFVVIYLLFYLSFFIFI